jgi:peptidoglycan hydrolase-like protein with peptidoglycan-binding domain
MAVFDCSKISLKKGSKGENVKTLQTHLKNLGYYNRKIDGDFGKYTKEAVKAFQKAYKITVDGWFGSKTCKKLNQAVDAKNNNNNNNTVESFDCKKVSLKRGSKDKAGVTKLQTMLKALGYYTRQIDGDFGKYTENAVKALQKATGHDPDGWFGPKTCPDLNKAYTARTGSSSAYTAKTGSSSVKQFKTTDTTPEHRRKLTAKLTVLPTVVVLPETEINPSTMTKTVTKGAINTDTNFDCSKINLSRGSKGGDVTKLQTILKARGYYTRQIDGAFGKYTKKAVIRLQQAQGNSPDGVFGPKTCSKLQGTSTTSNNATGTTDKKNTNLVITDFKSYSMNDDIEGLSHEVSISTPYSEDKMNRLRKLQKTQFDVYFGTDVIYQHEGYINEFKISQENDGLMIDLSLVGYTAFLDLQVDFEKTAKRSELIKELANLAGLKAEVDLTGLTDEEYTVKAQKAGTNTGGGGLVEVHGNDCTDTFSISARSYDIDACHGNTKIGDSNANYARDTANMTAKEAILDVYNRFHYGPSLTSSAVYQNNRRCPQQMWTKTGKFWGNCADISRLVKAVGEVHGLKVGIRHCPSHYYNLIEVNGTVYRFDCCFSSGRTGARYGSELCNNLTKNGGPWQS